MQKGIQFYAWGLVLLAIAFVTISLAAAYDTVAYLNQTTSGAFNQFEKAADAINLQIKEVFIPNKASLQVTKEVRVVNKVSDNGSSMSAFVRVRLVPVFRSEGNTSLMGAVEVPSNGTQHVFSPEGIGLKLILADDWSSNWFYRDGTFYYRRDIAPGNETTPLLKSVTAENTAVWNSFHVEVLVEAIQAQPPNLVEQAWGVVIKNGEMQTK